MLTREEATKASFISVARSQEALLYSLTQSSRDPSASDLDVADQVIAELRNTVMLLEPPGQPTVQTASLIERGGVSGSSTSRSAMSELLFSAVDGEADMLSNQEEAAPVGVTRRVSEFPISAEPGVPDLPGRIGSPPLLALDDLSSARTEVPAANSDPQSHDCLVLANATEEHEVVLKKGVIERQTEIAIPPAIEPTTIASASTVVAVTEERDAVKGERHTVTETPQAEPVVNHLAGSVIHRLKLQLAGLDSALSQCLQEHRNHQLVIPIGLRAGLDFLREDNDRIRSSQQPVDMREAQSKVEFKAQSNAEFKAQFKGEFRNEPDVTLSELEDGALVTSMACEPESTSVHPGGIGTAEEQPALVGIESENPVDAHIQGERGNTLEFPSAPIFNADSSVSEASEKVAIGGEWVEVKELIPEAASLAPYLSRALRTPFDSQSNRELETAFIHDATPQYAILPALPEFNRRYERDGRQNSTSRMNSNTSDIPLTEVSYRELEASPDLPVSPWRRAGAFEKFSPSRDDSVSDDSGDKHDVSASIDPSASALPVDRFRAPRAKELSETAQSFISKPVSDIDVINSKSASERIDGFFRSLLGSVQGNQEG